MTRATETLPEPAIEKQPVISKRLNGMVYLVSEGSLALLLAHGAERMSFQKDESLSLPSSKMIELFALCHAWTDGAGIGLLAMWT